MATTEPLTGVTVPQQTDAALGGLQIGTLATQIAPFTNPRFTTTAARDAAYAAYVAAGGALANGMHCWTDDAGQWDRIGGAWVLGATRSYADGQSGTLSLVAGWAAYGGYHGPTWYLGSNGWVTLSGAVQRTGASFALGSGTTFQFANLPAQLTPSATVSPGGAWALLGITTMGTFPVRIHVPFGSSFISVVGMDSGSGTVSTTDSFINLDGVRWHI